MSGDFNGLGMSAVYGRLFAELVEGAVNAACRVSAARPGRRPSEAACRAGATVRQVLAEAVTGGRLAPATAAKYGDVLEKFTAWLDRSCRPALDRTAVEAFLAGRTGQGIGSGARRVDLGALRTVLDRLLNLDVTRPLQYAPAPPPVEGVCREELQRLMAAAADDLDRALLLLLNVLKLRPGQIVRLRSADFHPSEQRLAVRPERGRRCLLLRLPPSLNDILLRLRNRSGRGEWLFSSGRQADRAVTVRALQKRLDRIGVRCGVEVSCTAVRKGESIIDGNACRQVAATPPPYSLPPYSNHPARIELSLAVFPEIALPQRAPPQRRSG